jgi:hypothetical protein
MALYKIADIFVEMTPCHNRLKKYAEKYLYVGNETPENVMKVEISEDILKMKNEEHSYLSAEDCEYIFFGACFASRLLKYNGFVLHSSAIAYKGNAYLFSADSGTGKSTHVGLWAKYLGDRVEIINDDKPAIRLIDGVFYAMGTPWSGKTSLNSDIAVPVGAVALLYRSKQNVITPAQTNDVVVSILKQTVLPRVDTKADILFDLLDKFVRSVKVFRFGCDVSEDAVKTSFEAMTGLPS